MLAEGIMLYLLVVRVFGKAAQKWYYLLILGWGKCTVHSFVLSSSCEVYLTHKRGTKVACVCKEETGKQLGYVTFNLDPPPPKIDYPGTNFSEL